MGRPDGIGVTFGVERGNADHEKGVHGHGYTVLEAGKHEIIQMSTKRGLKFRHAQNGWRSYVSNYT